MGEDKKVFLYAALFALAVFLAGILGGAIDYALNASIIDAIPASSVQWWNFFTFDHYMAWQFAHNQAVFFSIYIGIAVAIFVVFVIYWYYTD